MSKTSIQLVGRSLAAVTIAAGALTSASSAFASGIHASARASVVHTVQGTVLSDNLVRHTLVVASPSGQVRTLRFSAAQHVAVGTEVSAQVSALADGTFHASALHTHARAHSVRLHATVVSTRGRQLVLSSGGSVFSIVRPRLKAHDSSTTVQVGEEVNVNANFQGGSLDETTIQGTGTTAVVSLEGVVATLTSTSMTLNMEEGATATVTIPSSITLPSTLAAGDQVELQASYANQIFTLVTIVNDQAAATSASNGVNQSDQSQNSTLQIEGAVVATSATSLTIQPGDGASQVVVTIPSTVTVAPVVVGAQVHVVAGLVAGVLTLISLEVQASSSNGGDAMTTEAEGSVVSVSSTSLVIQPNDQGSPVSFTVPSTIDVSSLAAGNQVQASGDLVGGVLTLTHFELQGQDH